MTESTDVNADLIQKHPHTHTPGAMFNLGTPRPIQVDTQNSAIPDPVSLFGAMCLFLATDCERSDFCQYRSVYFLPSLLLQ